MKKLFAVFILIFTLQTPSQADDISDLQIEGMSVGDSFLDYLTEERIETLEKYIYENKKYIGVIVYPEDISKSFEVYEAVQVVYKADKKIIHSLEGFILYENNIEDCYPKKAEIVLELKKIFGDKVKAWNQNDSIYSGDESGKSKFSATNLDFKEGGGARVLCYNFDEEIQKIYNWTDKLTVVINSKEFDEYLSKAQY